MGDASFVKRGFVFDVTFYLGTETGDQEPGVSARFAGRAAFRQIKAAEYAPAGSKTTERKGKKKAG